MDDVYKRLAKRLDDLPNGFPATESGVELRILRKIFSTDDAAFALKLKPLPETAATIARRLRIPVDTARATLDRMAARGQIGSMRYQGALHYVFVPFVVGIYEFQLNHMDRELAEMFEEYAPTLLGTLGGSRPALARVVPVNTRITAKAQILPHEDMRTIIEKCSSFRIADCICAKEKELLGESCTHTREKCMSFALEENAYDGVAPWGREIGKEEALALLDKFEEEGLVHCTYNFQKAPFFVCNCCSCCCGFLRAVKEFHAPHMLASSSFVATIDAEACTACGDCADERCPMDAIAASDDVYTVDGQRCIGCGVCTVTCPGDAIELVPRPADEQLAPPRTFINWNIDRTDNRHGLLRGIGLRGWLTWEGLKMKAAQRRELR